jgi:hypothetical protein
VSGLTIGADGRPLAVLSAFGVFALADGRFVPLYRGSMAGTYQSSLGGLAVSVGSRPVGLVTASSGELYIATSA